MTKPNNSSSSNGLATTPQEEILLIHIGLAALTIGVGSVGVFWLKGTQWLVQHQVLVPTSARPMLAIPTAGGAGLDLPRVSIVAGVVVMLLAWAFSAARRALATREDPA